ncbi:MAG: hypothetical protein A4E31_00143 [Methanomassiliicoccales archaeon PtaU1.Bin030]|nr:MAG: hypothetical protein A4E31_00143 [Methanomassiliicoccales archaeon PtaU1.Bin030]
MADNSNLIVKWDSNYTFASGAGEFGAHQYDVIPASKQLEMMVKVLEKRVDVRTANAFYNALPEKLAYADWDANGYATLTEVSKKDLNFIGPNSGASNSTVTGRGVVSILAADTIQEGAMAYTCAEQAVKKRDMTVPMETMPFFTSTPYGAPVSAGSEAVDIAQDIGKNMLNVNTFRFMAKLGRELVNDSTSNIKAAALKELGKSQTLTLNRWVFTRLADFAGISVGVAASGSDATNMIDAVLLAQSNCADYGFMADTAVLWPNAWYQVYSKLIPMYNEYSMEQIEGKRALAYGGLTFHKCAVSAAAAYEVPDVSTGYSFGWSTASTAKTTSSIGAFVFEKERAGELGVLEEMQLEEFDDPVKYLVNPIVNSRWDFKCYKDDQISTRTNAYSVGVVYKHS